ncbi:MAG: DMT family transporter [Clostridiaceae bacterium]
MGTSTVLQLKSDKSKAILLLVMTAALWSIGGILIKSVNSHPLAIAGCRSAIAAIVLFIALKKPKITWSGPQIGAAAAYCITVIMFVIATKLTTAANAVLLQYSSPIYVAILGSWLLNEKAKLRDWVTIFIVICGMILFFFDQLNMSGIWGNFAALTAGVSFAFFAVFMRMQKDGSPMESVLIGNIMTAIIGVPFIFQSFPDANGWINLILLGVFQLGIPYIFYSKAIKSATALQAALIPIIEVLLNPVWVFLFIGEAPGSWALIGGSVVIIAVTVSCVLSILRD